MLGKDGPKNLDFNSLKNYFTSNQKNLPIKKPIPHKDKKKSTQKNINNLEKITGSGAINISGNQPIVVYKKQTKNKKVSKSPNPLNSKYIINKAKNEYVSDGGISQKIQKFNSNNNLNQNNNNNNNKLYYYNNYVSEIGQALPSNKNKKNNLEKNNNHNINNNSTNINKTKKQNFSKTVRDFNKRPNIKNNKDNNNKEINNKIKNSFDEKKIKHKIGNQNIIKNAKLYNKINKEDSKNPEEQKLIRMKQLVQDGVVNEIKKLEKKIKIQKKNSKIERKKEVLENQGLQINYFNEDNEEEEKKTESANSIHKFKEFYENNLNQQFMSKSTRGFYPRINNYIFQEEKNNNADNINQYQMKEKKKPSVNQFEFINKINSEKRKLNPNEFYSLNININHSNNLFQKRKQRSANMELNDSFRHKNSKQPKNQEINNIKSNLKIKHKSFKEGINRKSLDEMTDEFPFAHKTNHRTPEELKDFLKEKKLKQKKEEENTLLQKNKKLFLLYKNLYNLNIKDFSKHTPSISNENLLSISPPNNKSPTSKKMPTSNLIKHNININLIKKESNNSEESNNNNLRKKKELNQYYIGNDSSFKNNNSTLIDANEYYLNVLESQQLFVNSGLNKIEDFLDTTSNVNDSKDLNVSKEQIQKVITKEKNSSYKKNFNNLVLNTNEFDELRKKFEKTIKRAEKIFSKKPKEENNDIKEKPKEKKDINKDNNNNNIKNNSNKKEKEGNQKKNNIKSPEINIESSNEVQPKIIIDNIDTSENNTKEKNLPSLSHTFHTNSNPNKKVDIEIEPRAVFNLVEIIKFIIQRKVFLLLYETYINKALYQQYKIAFSFFVAICKQFAFRKLEEYCNYINYKLAFRKLFQPFIKRAFIRFRQNIFLKRKIDFLISCLDKLLKRKIFSKIKKYSILKSFSNSLIKQILKLNFPILKKNIKEKIEINEKIKKEKEKDINNKKLETKNELNHEDLDIKDDDNIDLSDNEQYEKRKNDDSVKMNSYVYESFESDSKSLSIEPNSENNDKLHQLKMMLLIKNNLYDDDSNSNSLNNSIQKIFSKKNKKQKNKKLDISDEDENKLKDIKNNEKINEKKEKNKEEEKISIDVSAEKDNSDDIEWGYDINKEDKFQKNKKDNLEDKKKDNHNNKLLKEELFDDDYDDFEKDINIKSIENKNENDNKVKLKDEYNNEKIKNDNKEKPEHNSNNLKVDIGIETEKLEEKQIEKQDEKIEEKPIISISKEQKENIAPKEKESLNQSNKEQNENIIENINKEKNINDKKQIEILKQNLNEDKEDIKEDLDKEKEKEKNKVKEQKQKELLNKKIKEITNIDEFVSSLTEKIISQLITSEVKSTKKKLIPLKKFKFDKFEKASTQNALNNSFGSAGNSHDHLSKEFGLSGLSNQLSLADELLSLNESLMSNYSSNSVFNKTIKDKKKAKSTTLYFKEIAPRLINLLRKEIISKYSLIYDNISTPMKNNSEKLMISLALQDAELLRDNYKNTTNIISISKILDKEKILKEFEPINKKIRNNDNVASDNFYDKMLNDCIIETAIEIINRERYYGKNGEPLQWSSRLHELAFKYKKNDPQKLADFVCNKLKFYIKRKVGLINDNYDEMSMEQINMEKDKRLTGIIKRDLDENEYQWNNLEMEETQLKVDNSEQIMEQLYNEVIEILEHIQYSRTKPEMYQNKSIYACEEIPKLDFQVTTTNEDATLYEGNDKK